jgi:hypothetical protein
VVGQVGFWDIERDWASLVVEIKLLTQQRTAWLMKGK